MVKITKQNKKDVHKIIYYYYGLLTHKQKKSNEENFKFLMEKRNKKMKNDKKSKLILKTNVKNLTKGRWSVLMASLAVY